MEGQREGGRERWRDGGREEERESSLSLARTHAERGRTSESRPYRYNPGRNAQKPTDGVFERGSHAARNYSGGRPFHAWMHQKRRDMCGGVAALSLPV